MFCFRFVVFLCLPALDLLCSVILLHPMVQNTTPCHSIRRNEPPRGLAQTNGPQKRRRNKSVQSQPLLTSLLPGPSNTHAAPFNPIQLSCRSSRRPPPAFPPLLRLVFPDRFTSRARETLLSAQASRAPSVHLLRADCVVMKFAKRTFAFAPTPLESLSTAQTRKFPFSPRHPQSARPPPQCSASRRRGRQA